MSPGGPVEANVASFENYRRAKELWKQLGEPRWEAEAMSAMALIEYNLEIPDLAKTARIEAWEDGIYLVGDDGSLGIGKALLAGQRVLLS